MNLKKVHQARNRAGNNLELRSSWTVWASTAWNVHEQFGSVILSHPFIPFRGPLSSPEHRWRDIATTAPWSWDRCAALSLKPWDQHPGVSKMERVTWLTTWLVNGVKLMNECHMTLPSFNFFVSDFQVSITSSMADIHGGTTHMWRVNKKLSGITDWRTEIFLPRWFSP